MVGVRILECVALSTVGAQIQSSTVVLVVREDHVIQIGLQEVLIRAVQQRRAVQLRRVDLTLIQTWLGLVLGHPGKNLGQIPQ